MMIALHKNARTTPAIRAEITASGDSAAALAQRFGITEATVYKWKKRASVHDASHTPHRLQTTLTPAQERVVVELRRMLSYCSCGIPSVGIALLPPPAALNMLCGYRSAPRPCSRCRWCHSRRPRGFHRPQPTSSATG